jgi:uncharacterized protein
MVLPGMNHMNNNIGGFDEARVLHDLKHYLPTQAPLKDFIHHNTLHAFQHLPFETAIRHASKIFGSKLSLSLDEYRDLYKAGKIDKEILERVASRRKGDSTKADFIKALLSRHYDQALTRRIGHVRKYWRDVYHLDLNTIVHTNLFRVLNSYLDQGVAITRFPVVNGSFLSSIRQLERNSLIGLLKTQHARELLADESMTITGLLLMLVGDERYFEQYLFDQQFAHPGWSGMVSMVEDMPESLLEARHITLREMIHFELILEIDNLDNSLGEKWLPLTAHITSEPVDLFALEPLSELDEVLNAWQEAYEWTYYDQVLGAISKNHVSYPEGTPSFQAFFCIDDRACSLRRYLEHFDPNCATYGTPGFFAVDAYYEPKNGKFNTKICPAPITPKHLIREVATKRQNGRDAHFEKTTHSLFRGWIISQTLGFWSAVKLLFNIFKPSLSPATSSSFNHMDELSTLTVENRSKTHIKNGLQIGYTLEEMTDRVERVLKSSGLVTQFSPIVYIVGHGASSANNTHYAAYDCGACSGRPGSANARAFSTMANHKGVRALLIERGIEIPEETEFVGGLHDTTRDEVIFYDEELLSPANQELHLRNQFYFRKALELNAKERARRFILINSEQTPGKVHKKVKERSLSLFEPRPELNHATNAVCIIGREQLNNRLFLDRRSFLNSYDYRIDPDGKFLAGIINAAAPVCGGINLEYYFSRVDNHNQGAGSKLPHNVMGLIGVANGFEGDLRTGLPSQMIEVHDPVRLLMIVEQYPEVVLDTIKRTPETYEWFVNDWVVLCAVNPDTQKIFRLQKGEFIAYTPCQFRLSTLHFDDLLKLVESNDENLPVYQLT